MLFSLLACIIGIVVENLKWPQDRAEAKERFLRAESAGQRVMLLVGLVLSHSVVRWLLSLAFAAIIFIVVVTRPGMIQSIKDFRQAHQIGPWMTFFLAEMVVSALMVLLSLAARWIGTPNTDTGRE
jgi:hypothetical protein